MSHDSYILWNLYMQIWILLLKQLQKYVANAWQRVSNARQTNFQGHHEKIS